MGSVLKYCKVPKYYDQYCKTKRQAEKVGSNIFLYSDTKIHENFLIKKNVKMTKQKHGFKGYESTSIVEGLS